jgi:hypothetical protein
MEWTWATVTRLVVEPVPRMPWPVAVVTLVPAHGWDIAFLVRQPASFVRRLTDAGVAVSELPPYRRADA